MLAALRREGMRVTTVVLSRKRDAAEAYALLDNRAAETVQVVLDYA